MIKKITIVAFFFVCVGAVAATKMYVDTEQKYIFTAENLAQTIPDFVTDDATQVAMARKYTDIMNQETGAVSVADLFAICRAGGMNTYRATGFETCRNFVTKLLENASVEFDTESIGGFCPGLDENGKNPNALRSITDKTKIGDFCSSQNIAAGEVVFRRGYNCTCAAYACNPGYESKGGACVTIVADAKGNCFRQVYTVSDREKYKPGESLKFCESKAVRGCKMHNAIRDFPSAGQITCNATSDEYASVVAKVKAKNTPCPEQIYPASAQNKNNTRDLCDKFCDIKATENNCKHVRTTIKHSTNQCVCNASESTLSSADIYKYVCAGDKGQTGGTERCVKVFNWTNVQMLQAVALAQSYARQKYSQSIVCSNKYRKSGNDDYLQCKSTIGNTYYEFQFDDIKETWDSTIDHHVRKALCEGIYDGDFIEESFSGTVCNRISQATCTKLNTSAAKFGYKFTWKSDNLGNHCVFGNAIKNGEKLAQVDGIDPYQFFDGIQIQANRSLIDSLKSYVQTVYGAKLTSFTCLNHFRHVAKIENHVTKGPSEDILRCTINGKTPVDFVFDDTSEFADTLSEGGYQNIDCRVIGGEYNGHDCMYLNKQQCEKLSALNATKCPTCKKIKWDGTYCVMPSAADAKDLEQNITTVTIVGGIVVGAVVTVATGGTGAPVLGLVMVETAGGFIELGTTKSIQNKIDQFLKDSQKCKNAQCAEHMIAQDLQRMANLSSDATDAQIVGIDAEFARLVNLLPSDSEFYKKIMTHGTSVAANQKGMFDADSWEPEQVWRAVGVVTQLTSLGKSIFGWAGRKLTRATATIRAGLRNASHTTNATRAAGNAADAARTSARTADAASQTTRTADSAAHTAETASQSSRTAGTAGRTADAASGAGDTANYMKNYFRGMSYEERLKYIGFKDGLDEFKRNGVSMIFPDEALSPQEWAALKRNLVSDGIELVRDEKYASWSFRRIGSAADDATRAAGNAVDAATDAARTGARTADAASGAAANADNFVDGFTESIIDAYEIKTPGAKQAVHRSMEERELGGHIAGQYIPDSKYTDLQEEYWLELADATTDAQVERAYSKYHNKMLDYLETKLDMNRVRTVAQDRRATYMNIIARDQNLTDQALNWSRLSERQQQQFMQTLVNRMNDGYGYGKPLRVTFESGGSNASNMVREINIDFTQGVGLRSDGLRQNLNIRNNFDDAMLVLSHEHAHSITRFAPDNGSLPKDYIGAAVIHLGTEGDVFETAEKTRNYLRSIYEKEGFTVGETVGKNFTRDLKRMVGRR